LLDDAEALGPIRAYLRNGEMRTTHRAMWRTGTPAVAR